MSIEQSQILKMLDDGKISIAEAEQLLTAIGQPPDGQPCHEGDSAAVSESRHKPKYLRVVVEPREGVEAEKSTRVNIRVPLALVRAGLNLHSLIPAEARLKINDALGEKGISFDVAEFTPEMIEQLIEGMSDLTLDVEDEDETVRVFCE